MLTWFDREMSGVYYSACTARYNSFIILALCTHKQTAHKNALNGYFFNVNKHYVLIFDICLLLRRPEFHTLLDDDAKSVDVIYTRAPHADAHRFGIAER